jgi:hypothetical protein
VKAPEEIWTFRRIAKRSMKFLQNWFVRAMILQVAAQMRLTTDQHTLVKLMIYAQVLDSNAME